MIQNVSTEAHLLMDGGNSVELEIKEYATVLKKRLWLILLVVAVVCVLVGFYSYRMVEPQYEASNKMIVTNKTEEKKSVLSSDDMDMGMRLVYTYKEIIGTSVILEKVVAQHPELKLTVKDLMDMMVVDTVQDTPVMTISVRDYSYDGALKVATAVADVFKSEISSIIPGGNITILYENNADPRPVTPSPLLYVVIAFVVSLMLSIGFCFLLEYLDDSIRTDKEVELVLGLPTLAVIQHFRSSDFKARGSSVSRRSPVEPPGSGKAIVNASE